MQSQFLVWAIRLGLWLFPFKWVNGCLSRFVSGKTAFEETDWGVINDVAGSVRATSKFVPYATCLTQALATKTLLRLNGQDSQMRIGVDKDEKESFLAHAWIEIDGKIVIGKLPRHQQRFVILNPTDSMVL